jgi:hypothetical protein
LPKLLKRITTKKKTLKNHTLLVRISFDKFWESVSLTFLLYLLSGELVEKIIDVREFCCDCKMFKYLPKWWK